MSHTYRLVFDCPDQIGIVAKVGHIIAENGGWISHATHHSDEEINHFFSRFEIQADSLLFGVDEFRAKFAKLEEEMQMNLQVFDSSIPKRVVMMASKDSHCLSDLLDRWSSGDIKCDIPCVISNHEYLRGLTEHYGIPFHHVPIDKDNKQKGFDEVEHLVGNYKADCIVLARYMQIIPQYLCGRYRHRMINIHHSFLPSFVGGKPYHQASRRGVKIIGATSHYVAEQLDEGPIIEQGVVPVTHSDTIEDLVRLGKDVEKIVLARGVRAHLEDRILVHDNKTVVF